jgi:hypothetical protein
VRPKFKSQDFFIFLLSSYHSYKVKYLYSNFLLEVIRNIHKKLLCKINSSLFCMPTMYHIFFTWHPFNILFNLLLVTSPLFIRNLEDILGNTIRNLLYLFWNLYLLWKLCRVLSQKLTFNDWSIWDLNLWSPWIKLWSDFSKIFIDINDWIFNNSINSKFNLFVQRNYGQTFWLVK